MHLFLLVPNNSGSSILHDLIATSAEVSILPAEGQFCENFVGPTAPKLGIAHYFTAKETVFQNPKNYEWSIIKNQWNRHWNSDNPNAKIKLQKSPPDILRADMLLKNFEDVKFILMIRNPYAMIESILRANPTASVENAAKHAVRCLEIQLENSEKYLDALVLRYEDLTDYIQETAEQLMKYLEISDINYNQEFSSKGYNSKIKNMNGYQIDRLTNEQIEIINKIFIPKNQVLQECGYEILQPKDFNFKFLGSIDINQFKDKIYNLDQNLWQAFTYRQETFDVHEKTNTVPLIFSEDFVSENVKYHEWFHLFSDELTQLTKILDKEYGFGYATRAILVKLDQGEEIPIHIDAGESLHVGHRVHLPLISNNDCYFTVAEETVVMREGELWEINNTNKPHSVKNLGNNDRVHLIIDWITVD